MGRERIIGVGVVLATAAAVSGGVAVAKPLEKGDFHDEFSFVEEDFCEVEGLTVQIDGVADGRFSAKTRGKDGLVYFAEHVRVARTFTNTDNGNVATNSDRVLNKDLKVIDNEDGTLTVILLATGNSTIYDASGKAIGRNPGQVRFEFLIDHAGTPGDPFDDELISEELIKGSTGRSDDFCTVIVPALT
jgi:hypothetical protein